MFRRKKPKRTQHMICPHCGSVFPSKSRVCPECGSDSQTGWSDYGNLADALAPETPVKESKGRNTGKTVLKVVSTVVATMLVYGLMAVWIPNGIYLGIPVVLAIIVILFLMWVKPFAGRMREKELEQELLAMTGHDPERVARLLQFEQLKNPDAPRPELLRAAYNRLLQDRR